MKTSTTVGLISATCLVGILAGAWGARLWREPRSSQPDTGTSAETADSVTAETTARSLDTQPESISLSRQNAITRAAARVGPAVVAVSVVQTRVVPARAAYDDFFSRFFFPRYYREQVRSMGSGVVVSADGYILTNEHVTEGADSIWVTLADGRSLPATLVGSDQETDLAVLRVSETGLPAVRMGDSDSLLIGEWAIALGNPFGYLLDDAKPTVTVGVISAVDRDIKHSPEEERVYRKVIQTDAAINPGNSGGPLVNSTGDVIGINSFIFSSSRGSEGIGFAIPINQAKVVFRDLVAWGEVRPAWVGVRLNSISDAPAASGAQGDLRGVVVQAVQPGSPAERAGLRPDDRIRKAGGRSVKNLADWDGVAHYWRPGDRVVLVVDRGSVRNEFELLLAARPLDQAEAVSVGFGLWAVALSPAVASQLGLADRAGAVVSGVEAGSPAARAGFERGDVIRGVDRVEVGSLDELQKRLSQATPHLVALEREGKRYVTALEP